MNTEKLLATVVAVLALLHLAAGALPVAYRWGYDHLHELSFWWRLLFALGWGCLLFPAAARPLVAAGRLLQHALFTAPRAGRNRALTALTALTLFLLLPEQRLWGDAAVITAGLAGPAADYFGFTFWREPLQDLLHLGLYRGLLSGLGAPGFFALMSALYGGLFVWLLLQYAADCCRTAGAYTAALVLGSGTLLLFFGHVEKYTLPHLLLLLFLLLAERARRAGRGDGWLLLSWLALAGSHAMLAVSGLALVAVPLLADLPRPDRWRRAALLAAGAVAGVAGGTVLLVAAGIAPPVIGWGHFAGDSSLVHPGLWRLSHGLELGNEYLLLAPVPVLVLLTGGGLLRRQLRDGGTQLLLAAAVPAVLLTLLFHHKQLLYKDWDLYAFAALPLALLAARLTAQKAAPLRARLVAAAWLHTLPWLLYNWR